MRLSRSFLKRGTRFISYSILSLFCTFFTLSIGESAAHAAYTPGWTVLTFNTASINNYVTLPLFGNLGATTVQVDWDYQDTFTDPGFGATLTNTSSFQHLYASPGNHIVAIQAVSGSITKFGYGAPVQLAVTATSGTGTVATYTVSSTAALLSGQSISITGSTVAAYNGIYTITVVNGTTFTAPSTGTGASTGTIANYGGVWAPQNSGIGYLTQVNQIGNTLQNLSGAFYGAVSLATVPASIPSSVTNLSYAFYGDVALNDTNFSTWGSGTIAVTTMANMFQNATAFNQNISGWDTRAVTDMSNMFNGATSFDNGGQALSYSGTPANGWDTEKVTTFASMFQGATGLDNASFGGSIAMAGWAVGTTASTGPTLASMFQNASNFNSDIHTWDTRTVVNMSSMFQTATSFNNGGQALSYDGTPSHGWDTEKVTTFANMFNGDTGLDQGTNIAMSGWLMGTTATTGPTLASMFQGATNFNSDIHTWRTETVINMSSMLQGATNFNNNNQPLQYSGTIANGWDTEKVQSFNNMFLGDTSLDFSTNISMTGWLLGTTASVAPTASAMFSGATYFNSDIHDWNTSVVTDVSSMFLNTHFNDNGVAMNAVVNGAWDLKNVTTLASMFSGDAFINVPMNSWNLGTNKSNVSAASMFLGASQFNQNIGGGVSWNTGKVINMSSMFQNATAFNQDISAWNTGLVTTMANIFNGSAENQNLGAWSMVSIAVGGLTTWESGFHVLQYSQTLSGWSTEALPTRAIVASVVASNYNTYNIAGKAARTKLQSFTWSFSGDGTLALSSATTVSSATPLIGSVVTFTATITGSGFADANGIGYPSFSSLSAIPVTATSGTGSLATYTVASTASLSNGQSVQITGSSVAGYNGTYTITVTSGTTFTTSATGTGASTGTTVIPTPTASMGSIPVTATSGTGTVATYTVASTAGMTTGQTVTIANSSVAGYNVSGVTITVTSSTTFTAAATGTGASSGTTVVLSPLWVITGTAGATSCNSATGTTTFTSATQSTYTCSINVVNGGTYLASFTYPGDSNYVTTLSNNTATAAKVNPQNTTVSANTYGIISTSGTGSVATYTVATTAGLTNGQSVTISGSSVAGYNGTFPITVVNGTTFTASTSGTGASTGGLATITPSATLGTSVVFTAIVTGSTNGATPGGTVTWTLSGTGGTGKSCTSTGPFGYAATGSTTSNVATWACTVTATSAGVYGVTFTYNATGDSNYVGFPTYVAGQVVSATTITVPQYSPAIAVVGNNATVLPGQPETFTSTLTVPNLAPSPYSSQAVSATSGSAGVATYTVASTANYVPGQSITITGSTVPAYNGTFTINTVPTGTTFTILNSGTGASSGTTATTGLGTWVVTVTPVAITGITGTGTVATYTVASTSGLSNGQTLTISGSSVAAYNGTYTITVTSATTFTTTSTGTGAAASATYVQATPTCTPATTPTGGPPKTTYTYSCTLTTSTPGNYGVNFSYPGDANYSSVSSTASSNKVTVQKNAPTIALATSAPTANSPATFTFTATVTGTITQSPFPTITGTGTFTFSGTGGSTVPGSTCSSVSISQTTTSGSNSQVTYTCTISAATQSGDYVASFTYNGDSNYASQLLSNGATTTVSAYDPSSSSPAISGTASPATVGSLVTFVAQVVGPVNASTAPTNGSFASTSVLSTSGTGTVATYTVASTSGLTTGDKIVITGASITAFNGTFTILSVTPTTFTTGSSGTGSASGATAARGVPTWTITNTGGTVTPTCSVSDGLTAVPSIGSGSSSANVASYTCSFYATNIGTYSANFSYPGDSNYKAISLNTTSGTQVAISRFPLNVGNPIVVTASTTSMAIGSTVTFTATVTGPSHALPLTQNGSWLIYNGGSSTSCSTTSSPSGSPPTTIFTCAVTPSVEVKVLKLR